MPTRAAFAFVFVTVLLDMLALGIMVPVLPKLIVSFSGGDLARAAQYSGLFGFVWAAMQFVVSPALGALSDRFGRRPVILLSNFGMALDYVLMAWAPSLAWLFLGRVLSGVTAATVSTAGAYIADVTPPERRAGRYGLLGAAFGLGFVVGPAIGGLLGAIDLRLPFWVCAGLSFANFLYGLVVLPESLPPERRATGAWANPLSALRVLTERKDMVWLAGGAFLFFLAHEALPAVFVLYTDHAFQWDAGRVGLALGGVGVCSMFVSAVLVGRVVPRLGERWALRIGVAAVAIGFVIQAFAATGWLFMGAIPFIALGGLTSPALQALLSRRVDATAQGRLQGAVASVRGVAGMIGPVLFTQVFAGAIDAFPGAPWLLGAVLLALGFGATLVG